MIDVPQLLALQSGFTGGPGDDYSGTNFNTGGISFTRNPQTGKWENPTSDDPALQRLIEQGVINGTNVDFGKLPATVYGQPFGDTSGAGFRQVQVENGRIVDPSGNWNIRYLTDVRNDPNYGWITPSVNLSNKENTIYDKIGQYLPGAIAAGMTLGAGAIGGAVPWYASAAMKALSGGITSPLSALSALAPGLGDFGVPSGAINAIQAGVAGENLYAGLQGQKQYQAPVSSVAQTTPVTPSFTPAGTATPSNVALPTGASQATAAPVATAAATSSVQYLPDPESGIPDLYSPQNFGGSGGSAQVISDQSAPVSTAVAPDAYDSSYSQIVS